MIHGNILPSPKLIKAIRLLKDGEFITVNGNAGIIYRFSKKQITEKHKIKVTNPVTVTEDVKAIKFPWDIFQLNDWAIREDFALIKGKRKSQAIPKSNKVVNPAKYIY